MPKIPTNLNASLDGHRPTWAEIDLDALASNFHVVRDHVGPSIRVMAVIKADAYGHGAVRCARRLALEGAEWFAVATPEEALQLREAEIEQPILSLDGFWEGQAAACLQHRLTPIVYQLDMIDALDRAAEVAGTVADVHVKVDTGMGRLGVRFDQLNEFAEGLQRFKNIRVDGLMTHLAAADDHSCDPLTRNQVQRFEVAAEVFRARGFNPTYRHLANSAGTFAHPAARGNMVRPGGVFYGLWRDVLPATTATNSAPRFQAVMSLRSRIALLKSVPAGETIGYGCTFETSRETLVATLPVGYHDGYMRSLSNRGRVIVRGVYASVIGRISMDFTLIDVTHVPGVAVNDVVTLLGPDTDQADRLVAAEDIAKTAGTISYEVTCGISSRVPRIYLPQ
jgi:alanine racemase